MHQELQHPPRVRYIALLALTVLSTGAVFYHHVEKLSWLDSIYFCVISLATVGYGDITPKTDAGKIFTIFYVIIGIGIFAASVNYLVKRAAMNRLQNRDDRIEESKSNK
mgnify:FL=1